MLTLALVPVYRCLVWYNQFAFRITIFNNIVQCHCNMCTKSPVREIATIEGTSIHQKDGQTITTIWESGLFFFLFFSNSVQYETHLYDTRFPPLLVIVISSWPITGQIKNRQMSVWPFALPHTCTRVPKMSPARWSRTVGMKCVMLCSQPSPTHTTR